MGGRGGSSGKGGKSGGGSKKLGGASKEVTKAAQDIDSAIKKEYGNDYGLRHISDSGSGEFDTSVYNMTYKGKTYKENRNLYIRKSASTGEAIYFVGDKRKKTPRTAAEGMMYG